MKRTMLFMTAFVIFDEVLVKQGCAILTRLKAVDFLIMVIFIKIHMWFRAERDENPACARFCAVIVNIFVSPSPCPPKKGYSTCPTVGFCSTRSISCTGSSPGACGSAENASLLLISALERRCLMTFSDMSRSRSRRRRLCRAAVVCASALSFVTILDTLLLDRVLRRVDSRALRCVRDSFLEILTFVGVCTR